jgi:2,3-bisphosphoglycerate-dependent phosphoglycerate mutase
MILYCVRHGESCYNAQGRIQGQSNTPLSPLGLLQAQAVSDALRTLDIDAIYCSPLERARQTAQPLADALQLDVRSDPRLMEIHVGIFQDRLHAEIAEVYPQETARWRSSEADYRIPGGESRRDLMVRAAAAFEAIRAAGHKRVVIVSHGGTFASAFKALLGISAERNPFSLYNASISQVHWARQFKLLTLNDTRHLAAAGCERISTGADFF